MSRVLCICVQIGQLFARHLNPYLLYILYIVL